MSKPYAMSFLSSAAFWGIIIILIGMSIILKAVFGINIPLFRIVAGFLLIYLGVRMLAGGFWNMRSSSSSAIFTEAHIDYSENQREYNIIFGNGTIDLFKIEPEPDNKKIEVNVAFGNGTLILNDSIPALVEISSVFGSAITPDKSITAMGSSSYTTSAYKSNEPYVFIKADVVFGKLKIKSKKW